jgi:ubiquinone/menaquinone biosynthesis C-methylase UbiE
MLEVARTRANQLGREIDLRARDAQDLDFEDGAFDTVVAILVLSAIPDQGRAIAEIRRVLRPDGRLLVLDNVRSDVAPVRWVQRAFDPVLDRFARWHSGAIRLPTWHRPDSRSSDPTGLRSAC